MQTPASWPASKKELLVLIPKLRKVPEDKAPEFYGEVAKKFMRQAEDELELDARIDDLVNGIECFCDEDDAHYQRKMGIWAKKAVKSFIDAKIFSTKMGREFLLEQIEQSSQLETTPFEQYVIEIIEMLARHSFVLTVDGEIAAHAVGRPIRALIGN